jgi:hypothetical protein
MYRARSEGLTEMWRYLDEMWTDRLGRLKVAAERAEWPERRRGQLDEERAANHSRSADGSEGDRRD